MKKTGGGSYDNQSNAVHVNGTVEAGLNNKQFLIIDEQIGNSNIVMSGTSALVFHNSTGQDVVTRSDAGGSWITDGFVVGQFIRISGTTGLDGAYLIDSLTATTITLNAKTPLGTTIGTTNAANVTVQHYIMTGNPALDFDMAKNSLTRSVGSWVNDGFVVGQQIVVDGSGANDNFYTIKGISVDGATDPLDSSAVLASTAHVAGGVTIKAIETPTTPVVGSVKTVLSFDTAGDTITRSLGNWSADGFMVGQTLIVAGTANNNGTYTIKTVTETTITLNQHLNSSDTNVASSTVTANTGAATVHNGALTMSFDATNRTITRNDGVNWSASGIVAGQVINIAGSVNNDGCYTIASVSGSIITLIAGDALVTDATVFAVTVRGAAQKNYAVTRQSPRPDPY